MKGRAKSNQDPTPKAQNHFLSSSVRANTKPKSSLILKTDITHRVRHYDINLDTDDMIIPQYNPISPATSFLMP